MSSQEWPTPTPNGLQELLVHRNDDELRGRFANTFTVHYNGDNFAVEFFTSMPRQV